MTNVPIKKLKDKNRQDFVPFTVTDAVFVPNSDKTISEFLDEQVERIDEALTDLKDYEDLSHKPQINSIELTGNKSLDDLDIQPKGNYPDVALTNNDIDSLLNNFAE